MDNYTLRPAMTGIEAWYLYRDDKLIGKFTDPVTPNQLLFDAYGITARRGKPMAKKVTSETLLERFAQQSRSNGLAKTLNDPMPVGRYKGIKVELVANHHPDYLLRMVQTMPRHFDFNDQVHKYIRAQALRIKMLDKQALNGDISSGRVLQELNTDVERLNY